MKLVTSLLIHLLPALAPSCLAAPANNAEPGPAVLADYDAIIVGGGPAGLSACSGLARVRRRVLLIDSGEYRNAQTRHMHDVIDLDGLTGASFRWVARKQINDYDTATLVNGTVTKIIPQANNTFFTVQATYPGNHAVSFTARKVILASGLRDLLPATPGLQENWGQGIYWCPWCDGHEHADQALGIVGPLESGPTTVREILTLNREIVLIVNGTDTAEHRALAEKKFPKWSQYLKSLNIKVENRTVASIERLLNGTTGDEDPSQPSVPEHDLFQINFVEGEGGAGAGGGPPLLRAALLTNFPEEQRSTLGQETGVTLYGGKLYADPVNGYVTNIPGIYAIGDANTDNTTNVPHAMYTGKRAAVFLHVKLETENSEATLASAPDDDDDADLDAPQKRDADAHLRSVWTRMNGPREDDLLDAGVF